MKKARIPKFKTTSEEAVFWDAHSTESYVRGKPIRNPLKGPFLHMIGVTLTSEEMDVLDVLAKERRVKSAMKMANILLRELLAEHVKSGSRERRAQLPPQKARAAKGKA